MTFVTEKIYNINSIEYDFSKRTYIMGVLNVTPDSFSDGRKYFDKELAIEHGLRLIDDGADFLDIGGESTRPGAVSVTTEEEISRVLPVIEEILKKNQIPVSIDTTKSEVAEKAIQAGASIINDISGLHFDTNMVDVASRYDVPIVLMHIKGKPQDMQNNPEYENVVEDISDYLEKGIKIANEKGIHKIFIDPGIGFGKKLEHNIEIFKNLKKFKKFNYPLLIGPSRKAFIGNILDLPIDQRLEGTAAAVALSIMNGANVVRVHDVKEMKRVVKIVDALK